MHADFTHKIEEVQRVEPVSVVNDLCAALGKVQKPRHLFLKACGVVRELLPAHQRTHIRLAGRIADERGSVAKERDRLMPRALHMRHRHQLYVMTDVKAVRRRVKANIKRDFLFAEQFAQFFGMRALLQKAALFQYIVYVAFHFWVSSVCVSLLSLLRTKHICFCAQPNIPRKKRRNNAAGTVSSLCFCLVFKTLFVCSHLI